jgi:L-arginine dehydrogenase
VSGAGDRPRVVLAEELPELPPARVNEAVRAAFRALSAGRAEQPLQSVLPLERGGDVITYPSALHDAGVFCLKVSPYLPQPSGPAVVTAWTLLMSTVTGQPLLLVDSGGLTVLRTAATTALAVDLLARPQARRLLVVGAGAAGRAHLRHVALVRDFDELQIWSRSGVPDADALRATEVDDLAAAVARADVVCLCTSAAEPVIDLSSVAPGALVTSISTNAAQAHEVAPQALALADVYCDHAPACVVAAGEMLLAVQEGTWSAEQVRGDLPRLLGGACAPPSGDRPVFFRSVGLGIEDAAVALAVARS